jgi:hypothetical protein
MKREAVYFDKMKIGKRMLVHGAWCLVALAAFWLGSIRNASPDSAGKNGAPGSSGDRRASSADASDGSPATRDRTRPGRRSSGSADSPLTRLFGNKSAAAGLDSLAFQALRDPNQITRRLAFSKLLESMTAENAGQIRAQLVELGAEPDQWRDFNYSWGAIAGQDAFDAAAKTKERDLNDTLTGWAAANPKAAMAALDNLPPELENQRGELTRSVVAGLADCDRALASEMVQRLSQEGNKDAPGLMEIVARETIRADGIENASRWSESLPDGSLKGAAMNLIAGELSRRDPEAAAAWAQRHAAEDYATRAIGRIGGQWSSQNPEAAVGWLASLPAGQGQTAGMTAAFNNWEDSDPVAASNYLFSMPSSQLRDTSISGFAGGYAWQNPELSMQWAQSIENPALREQTITRVGQIYLRQKPADGRAWLESSNIAPEIKQRISNNPIR